MGLSVAFSMTVQESGKRGRKVDFVRSGLDGEINFQELLQFSKESMIEISIDTLRTAQSAGEFPTKEFNTLVDGRPSNNLFNVKYLGQIQFLSKAVAIKELKTIYDILIKSSVVDTGFYMENHAVFFNGKMVAKDRQQFDTWITSNPEFTASRNIVRFVNLTPYARKLELEGTSKGQIKKRIGLSSNKKRRNRGITVRKPNGTYYLTSKVAKALLKSSAKVRFEFLPGGEFKGNPFPSSDKRGKKLRKTFSDMWGRGRAGRPYLYPTIEIEFITGAFQ